MAISAVVVVAALVSGIIGGKNIRSRFSTTTADLTTRVEHWSSAISLVNQTPWGSWFGAGWNHWFLFCKNHLRGHIKNIFIYWYFEGGWLGLLAMLSLFAFVGVRLIRRALRGDRLALIAASSLAGVVMVGLFDSVFDEPRIATLTLFLGLAALQITRPRVRARTP